VADAIAERRLERERLIALAREYVERLSARVTVEAAAVVGSVARGDFNVWSDVDVVVVANADPEFRAAIDGRRQGQRVIDLVRIEPAGRPGDAAYEGIAW